MWGEQWGTMIWGGFTGVLTVSVPIGPAALIILGFLLGISALKWQSSRVSKLFIVSLAMGLPLLVVATTLPHQFVNGTVADADEVNANFSALEQQIIIQKPVFEVSVSGNGVSPQTLVNIDQTVFADFCGDANGCVARICYSSFSDPADDPAGLPACLGSRHISYDEASGKWRAGTLEEAGLNFSTSTDNNAAASNLAKFGSCFINDADVIDPVLGEQDTAAGFSVLNTSPTAGVTCSVVLSD